MHETVPFITGLRLLRKEHKIIADTYHSLKRLLQHHSFGTCEEHKNNSWIHAGSREDPSYPFLGRKSFLLFDAVKVHLVVECLPVDLQ